MAIIPQFKLNNPDLTEVGRIEGSQADKRRQFKLRGTTTGTGGVELFVDGVSGNRIGINADSVVLAFYQAVGRAPSAANSVTVYGEVGITRFGSTTTIVANSTQTKMPTAATHTLTVAADDTNEALTFTAAGISATNIIWEVEVYLVESSDFDLVP